MAKPGYKEYSRVASGGIIYENPDAPPEKRWLLEHEHFGNRYFAKHDDILMWTVEETRRRFNTITLEETDGQHRTPKIIGLLTGTRK